MELKVNTEEIPGSQGTATVLLGHLKSYSDMAVAVAECRSGCRCTRSLIDGLWKTKVSLMQMHKLEVRQQAGRKGREGGEAARISSDLVKWLDLGRLTCTCCMSAGHPACQVHHSGDSNRA
jgi:hypothetical protein